MKNKNIKHILSGLFLALFSLQMQSCGGNKDPEIQTAIASETRSNPHLARVTATVLDGAVTLSGQCNDEDCRKNAEKAIKKLGGVKKVTNNIIITSAANVTPDNELKDKTKKIMSKYKDAQAEVSNGVITLRGEIRQNKLEQLITELNEIHPKRIDNQLAVR